MTHNEALDEAKKRLAQGRKAREQRRKQIKHVEEPEFLRSGDFDEIELKRIEKYGDRDE